MLQIGMELIVKIAQRRTACPWRHAVRVSALHHKVVEDSVENRAVVEIGFGQLNDAIGSSRRPVFEQLKCHVALNDRACDRALQDADLQAAISFGNECADGRIAARRRKRQDLAFGVRPVQRDMQRRTGEQRDVRDRRQRGRQQAASLQTFDQRSAVSLPSGTSLVPIFQARKSSTLQILQPRKSTHRFLNSVLESFDLAVVNHTPRSSKMKLSAPTSRRNLPPRRRYGNRTRRTIDSLGGSIEDFSLSNATHRFAHRHRKSLAPAAARRNTLLKQATLCTRTAKRVPIG